MGRQWGSLEQLQLVEHELGAREGRLAGGVEYPSAVAARRYQAGAAKRPQVMRHEGLAESCRLHEVGDGAFTCGQKLEQPNARFVAERAKAQRGDGAGALWVDRHARNI